MRAWPAADISSLDDLILASLVDYEVAAIDEDASRVFFHTPAARDHAVAALQRQFPTIQFRAIDVADEDWAARSQADLKAVRVGNIIVAPPWEVPPELKFGPTSSYVGPNVSSGAKEPHVGPNVSSGVKDPHVGPNVSSGAKDPHVGPNVSSGVKDPHVGPNFSSGVITIVIQPSMGFGTGHHATTRLCLDHLQRIDVHGRTTIDVGTGSGVLAIAASRLGAIQVLAIDDDPDAVASAWGNIDLNPGVEVTLGTTDLRSAALRPFDLVLANLTGGLLVASARILLQLTTRGGRLVLSGFMESEEADVLAAFASCEVEQRSQEDEWVCVTLLRL